jgi:lysophospholipase L1-like esterase
MKKFFFPLLLLPTLLLAQIELKVPKPIKFLALGDSYTIGQSVLASQNWPNQLKDSLAVRGDSTTLLRIIATTGWRTDNLLSAITNQGLDTFGFNLVSLLIGVNNQYQGTPYSQYTSQFPQLVDSAIRYAGGDTSHVFIVSIPDYAYTPFGIQSGDTAMISAQIDTYNLFAQQYAASLHIQYFNITPISRMGLADPALIDTIDGLHPSPLQYSMWISLMLPTIDSSLSDTTVTTGIASVNPTGGIYIYPNPVRDELTISNSNSKDGYLQIFNMLGQEMIDEKLPASYSTIAVSSYPPGLYTVRVSSATGQWLGKVVKQ